MLGVGEEAQRAEHADQRGADLMAHRREEGPLRAIGSLRLLCRSREPLYFRLAGITLTVPPLRSRTAEIEPLARAIAARAAASLRRVDPTLSREALTELQRYPWPGNVRELRNVMERAVVLAPGSTILPEHLLLAPTQPEAPTRAAATRTLEASPSTLHEELGSIARQRILDALEACAGNQTQAALMLGMPRRTFVARLDDYGIPRPLKGPAKTT